MENTVCSSVDTDAKHAVQIGTGNVFGPLVKIRTGGGPICIGDGNVFDGLVELRNVLPPNADGTPQTLTIGSRNHFGTRCCVHAQSVGSDNVFHADTKLLVGSNVGSFVTVTAKRSVESGVAVPDNTIVYGRDGETRRRDHTGQPADYLPKLRKYLAQTLPDFHKCRAGLGNSDAKSVASSPTA
eukprot:TRINITY_DN13479_c0_g1_i1.p2 TRINITY_DN13479_c0_g1~~TRINITY_DN13479_c0_g1_i1.p2  ORF type:complete len:184 (+),score=28.24 TRINITY_DN13479_c0_g1_i1:36-587(+)